MIRVHHRQRQGHAADRQGAARSEGLSKQCVQLKTLALAFNACNVESADAALFPAFAECRPACAFACYWTMVNALERVSPLAT